MTTPKKFTTEHICFRDKEITEIHKIVVGNGDPDKSLVRKVAIIGERQGTILKTLENIDGSLKSLDKKYDNTILVAKQAKDAVDKFKVEEIAFDEGQEQQKNELKEAEASRELKKKERFVKWMQILALVISIGVLYLGYKNLMHKNDQIETKVNGQGIPLVLDKRGNLLALPDSSQIKWFSNDTLRYIIIKDIK